MDETTRQMHLTAGMHYGREATCGTKYDYRTEAKADMAARAVSLRHSDGKVLEAYPCFFCEGWHIGRAMSADERATFTHGGVTGYADDACKASVSGSTPDIASMDEKARRELAYEHRGELASPDGESVRPKLFERSPGNVYELPDTPENRELLETIEDNRQHPERGRPRPNRPHRESE